MLKVGNIIKIGKDKYEVLLVNDTRARVRPMFKVTTTLQAYNKKGEQVTRTFTKNAPDTDISSGAEYKIVGQNKKAKKPKRYRIAGYLMPVE